MNTASNFDERIAQLIIQYNQGNLNTDGEQELRSWRNADPRHAQLFDELTDPDRLRIHIGTIDQYDAQEGWQKIEHLIPIPAKVVHFLRMRAWWAAAAVLLLITSGIFFIYNSRQASSEKKNLVITQPEIKAPQSSKASITLSNGKIISLDSATNGTITSEAGIKVEQLSNGQIAYIEDDAKNVQTAFHTLNNPRGSTVINMLLEDGSKVWLNAGSSITYPVAFKGKDRKVSITGEAYFEVNHDPSRPFYVSNGSMQVQVLGTHFNINAYEDEGDIRVTLLEGAVKVSNGINALSLTPGQQSVIKNTEAPVLNKSVDVNRVMAWKNGRFDFDGADMQAIARQLSRWYNVKIEIRDVIPGTFVANISRDVSVSEVLKLLQLTNNVHFMIEADKIIVIK